MRGGSLPDREVWYQGESTLSGQGRPCSSCQAIGELHFGKSVRAVSPVETSQESVSPFQAESLSQSVCWQRPVACVGLDQPGLRTGLKLNDAFNAKLATDLAQLRSQLWSQEGAARQKPTWQGGLH